ncbi:MAG: Hsp33 family molecular chaperone HslO [Myxococcales bacterium]|nr:Hsp33 family molecular chaperone HslO [Myxococcales bacterium]
MADPITDTDNLSPVERYKLAREARRVAPAQTLPTVPEITEDTLWRGLTREGEVRILVVRATEAVHQATQRLGCSPAAAKLVGELMAGTQLLRACLNPDEQLQLGSKNAGSAGNFVVDSYAEGHMRATVRNPKATLDDGLLVGNGTLQVARTRPGRSTYRSAITMEHDDIDGLLMRYLMESEQILSLLRLDVQVTPEGTVEHALGFLVQLMPEGTKEDLGCLVNNLETLPELSTGMTADDPDAMGWANALMSGLYWDQAARQDVGFFCPCSAERVLTLLSTLPQSDLQELADGGEPLESTCDYCKTTYTVPLDQLQALMASPS